MLSLHSSTYLWQPETGLTQPQETDWHQLGITFGIPPFALERSLARDQRSHLLDCEPLLLLTLRLWHGLTGTNADDLEDVTREQDIFVGENFVLIRTDEPLAPFPSGVRTTADALAHLLDSAMDSCYPAMDLIDEAIDGMETVAYAPDGQMDIAMALALKKQLLLLRQTVAPLRDVLNQLLRTSHTVLTPALYPHLQDVYDRALRLTEQIDLHRDILSGVLDAILAQTSNRLNQQMKRLTALAAIVLPITAITGFFGMNIGHFDQAPAWAIYAASSTMALASGITFFYFRRRGYW